MTTTFECECGKKCVEIQDGGVTAYNVKLSCSNCGKYLVGIINENLWTSEVKYKQEGGE